jgi:triphosphoribosyl-dephospho-CoA synthase
MGRDSAASAAAIEAAFLAACDDELAALKPGNVHRFADGHRMTVADFQASAAAAAPGIALAGAPVGERILTAVEATRAAVGTNTNLGIVLLCAPLAAAAEAPARRDLADRLAGVLVRLTVADADAAFRAIRLAAPAGLGRAAEHDVALPAQVDLGEAMAAAADRDIIARQYATGFADVFAALGVFRTADAELADRAAATTLLHLGLLAAMPDSHVARKHGTAAAEALRAEAEDMLKVVGTDPRPHEEALLAFDTELKRRGVNPGTTADLVVATLFADRLGA